ncbi:MAG: hypothetical protein IT289_09530 [Oligoflexia bacterium]|nr:hypothetical protein [Oligoflexia bacterium]
MDLRRPLFQIEEWSPRLAQILWPWVSRLEWPNLTSGFCTIKSLSDEEVKVSVPALRWNSDATGRMTPMAIMAGAELAGRTLWARHNDSRFEVLVLRSIQARFLKPAVGPLMVSCQLSHGDRETILNEVRQGRKASNEMMGTAVDQNQQLVAQIDMEWDIQPTELKSLNEGSLK